MRLKGLAAATAGVLIVAGLGFVSSAASATTAIVPGHLPYPSGGNGAIGVGVDSANQNAQLSDSVPATVAPSWHSASPTCPQAAGSGAVSISVSGTHTVVDETAYQCSFVSSYDTSTGALQWRQSYHFARNAIVSGSTVFVLHDAANGFYLLDAIDLATGAVLWSKPDGQPSDYTLSAGSGIVINNSTALNAATGAPAFTLQTGYTGSSHGVSMVSGGVVYYNDGIRVAAFSATTGARLWKYDKGTGVDDPGSGIAEPSLHNGLLYVNSTAQYAPATTLVLNPSTGALVRTVPRTDMSLAFDGNIGIFVANDSADVAPTVISAIDLTTGQTYWTHKLSMWETQPWQVQTAPIIENGLVWLSVAANTGSSAEFVALDEATGAEKSDTVTPCLTSQGNLVVAQHRLLESSDCGVETYVPASGATPVPPTPGEILTDPGFESSTSGWVPDTSGSINRVSSPTHTGSGALRVMPTASTNPGKVGIEQKTALTNLTKGSWYRMSCWVMPTAPGLDFMFGETELKADGSVFQSLASGTASTSLPTGVWSYFTINAGVNVTGDSLVPELFSRKATTATGGLIFDDCSITPGYIAPPVTEIDPPSAPQSVSAVPGDGSATISFTPPTSNGGAPVTQYVAVSSPGGLAAVGTGSPLTVHGLTNGVTYTFVVTATNSAGTGVASAATKPIIPEPAGKTVQFLPDPGFESGAGGWQIFTTGTLTRVTTPVHSGGHAVQVAAAAGTPGIVGLTQNTAASATTAGATYTASCWVRPTTGGLNLTLRFLEYARDYSSDTHLGVTTVASLPTGVWTQVVVTSKAVVSGDRMIPQIYSTNQTTATGTIAYDDCSLTTGP